jgi:multisubunit Na+/H+ antiporter MnhB subunit
MKIIPPRPAALTIISISIALAMYFFLLGAYFPGGGFAAGIMIATAYITALFAFGKESVERYCCARQLLALCCMGMSLYILLALLGASNFGSGSFLSDAFIHSKTLSAIALNLSMAIAFGAGISCIAAIFFNYSPEEPD